MTCRHKVIYIPVLNSLVLTYEALRNKSDIWSQWSQWEFAIRSCIFFYPEFSNKLIFQAYIFSLKSL